MHRRILTTAMGLNLMIQEHIDKIQVGSYVWHTGVYLQEPDGTGCNWNVAINCNAEALECGPVISAFIDDLRSRFLISADDVSAVAAY